MAEYLRGQANRPGESDSLEFLVKYALVIVAIVLIGLGFELQKSPHHIVAILSCVCFPLAAAAIIIAIRLGE